MLPELSTNWPAYAGIAISVLWGLYLYRDQITAALPKPKPAPIPIPDVAGKLIPEPLKPQPDLLGILQALISAALKSGDDALAKDAVEVLERYIDRQLKQSETT